MFCLGPCEKATTKRPYERTVFLSQLEYLGLLRFNAREQDTQVKKKVCEVIKVRQIKTMYGSLQSLKAFGVKISDYTTVRRPLFAASWCSIFTQNYTPWCRHLKTGNKNHKNHLGVFYAELQAGIQRESTAATRAIQP